MRRRTTRGSLTQSVRRLAAYVPTTLAAQILRQEGVPQPGESHRLLAATLFMDISGFTAMTRELATDGPRGAEELNRILLMTFTAMINAIHTSGGAVIHFHGDAMLVYFPDDDGQAATRALACSGFMMGLMQRGYSEVKVTRTDGSEDQFELAIKVGVGYGRCVEVVVGDAAGSLEFVVAGPAITEASSAQQLASDGEVIASETVLRQAGLPANEPYRLVTEVLPVPYAPPILFLGSYDKMRLQQLLQVATHFLHPTLVERILDDKASFVAEHRPVTSLFVGFDGIDFDEPDAGQKLQQYYNWAVEVVARHGGPNSRLNRVLTGDKGNQLHIIFGAPVAPDAPDHALRCALALQSERPEFITQQQVGVTTGKVFACAVGSGNRREYTILGAMVNLSSRIAAVSPDGAVLTDTATMRRTEHLVDYVEHSEVALKGYEQPVRVYRLLGEKQASPGARHNPVGNNRPLLGREDEQAELLDALDTAFSGEGRIVVVTGPVGAGRSRLISVGVNRWMGQNGMVLGGVGQQHLTDRPYSLWRSVWRDFFNFRADMDKTAQRRAVRTLVERLYPDGVADLHFWFDVLGISPDNQVKTGELLTNEMRKERLHALIGAVFAAAALEQPILLAMEDIHWADTLSLELLEEMAVRWERQPLSMCLTYLPNEHFVPRLQSLDQTTHIHLADLSLIEGRLLAKRFLNGADLPPALERHLGLHDERSRINPYFLEESIQMLLDIGVLEPDGSLLVDAQALDKLDVPDSIYSLLLARLDQLSGQSRNILQIAAVIGRQFDLDILLDVEPDLQEMELASSLGELTESQMIRPASSATKRTYIFRNDMIRDVGYQSIPYARRQMLHGTVAQCLLTRYDDHLQPHYAALAHHFGHTDLHELGLQYAVAAADDARAILAGEAAIELYNLADRHIKAMGEQANWQLAAHVWLSRAEMQKIAGANEQAMLDAREVVALALGHGDSLFSSKACNLLAELQLLELPGESVLDLANKVVHELPRPIPPDELARAWCTRAEALTYLGRFETAAASLQMAVELFESGDEKAGLVRAHLLWGYEYCCQLGEWGEARHHLDVAAELMREAPEQFPDAIVLLYLALGFVELQSGVVAQAESYLGEAVAQASKHGLGWWRPAIYYYQGTARMAEDDVAGAHAMLHLALGAVQDGGNPDYLPLINLGLAQLTSSLEQRDRFVKATRAALARRARQNDREYCLETMATLQA